MLNYVIFTTFKIIIILAYWPKVHGSLEGIPILFKLTGEKLSAEKAVTGMMSDRLKGVPCGSNYRSGTSLQDVWFKEIAKCQPSF